MYYFSLKTLKRCVSTGLTSVNTVKMKELAEAERRGEGEECSPR